MLRLRKGEEHLFIYDNNLLQTIHSVIKKLLFGGLLD